MTTLNETPSANRLHIGIFGKTNSGKSSFINAFTRQKVSIVADVAGTTTDPVYKPMEIYPIGSCVMIDTAGFDDTSSLGKQRIEKTKLAAEKTDIAVIIISAAETVMNDLELSKATEAAFSKNFPEEYKWYRFFLQKNTPVLFIISKEDENPENAFNIKQFIEKVTSKTALSISSSDKDKINEVKIALTRQMPENYGSDLITGSLVSENDLVLLVMPQDIQAPKGRLILPQVQTLRELLDKKCIVMSVTTDKLTAALATLQKPPKLIITDSQVFPYVYEKKPAESMLTSFSVLFAAYKGDLPYFVEGVKAIERLTDYSKVLIAECCTHAPLEEDIGRVKIPRLLHKRIGEKLQITHVRGTDFPEDLSGYDLIIQCGACMFNRKYVLSRIERAKKQSIPMTNYGVTIAYLTGILEHVSMP